METDNYLSDAVKLAAQKAKYDHQVKRKLTQGSLKFSTSMKLNIFREILIPTMHLLWI